ncbi:unnamed protein product [Moneuplotes crassus]|uniref:Uncharacterized protein n=2 Tax=Euplotes crassus TaxID=5936 RepID=A0AAD2D4I7_EUPCR|nr:unnamed protein product [Moneuplotes crassus]
MFKKKKKQSEEDKLYDMAFEMNFQAKQLNKQAVKIEGQMKKEEAKVLALMNSGNNEAAKITAEGVIRMKGEALNVRRMGAQLGAVGQKLQAASRTAMISQSIKNAVPLITKGLKQMEKMGIDKAMCQFDTAMEELDVKTDSLNAGLGGVYSSTLDQTEVDSYMSKLMDSQAHEMDVNSVGVSKAELKAGPEEEKSESDDLMARLRDLQG